MSAGRRKAGAPAALAHPLERAGARSGRAQRAQRITRRVGYRGMCDLTKLRQQEQEERSRKLPERSPDRGPEAAPEQQPKASPVFHVHGDSPERQSDAVLRPHSGSGDKPHTGAAAATGKLDRVGNHANKPARTDAAAASGNGAPKRSANAVAAAAHHAVRDAKSQGGSSGQAGKKARHDSRSNRPRDPLLAASLLARHIPAANSAAQIRQWFSQFGEVTAVMLTAGQGNEDEVQALVTFASEEECDQARARCAQSITELRQQQKKQPVKAVAAANAVADIDMARIIRQAVTHMHDCGIDTDPWPIQHASAHNRGGMTAASAQMHRHRKRKQSDSRPWTEQETARLLEAAYRTRATNWPKIARYVGGRSEEACQLQFGAVLREDPQRVEAAALMSSPYVDASQDEEEASVTAPKRVKLVVGSKPSNKSPPTQQTKSLPTQQTKSAPTQQTSPPADVPWTPKEDATLAQLVRSQVSRAHALKLTKDDWTEIAAQLNTALQTGAQRLSTHEVDRLSGANISVGSEAGCCVLAAGRSNKDCFTRWLRHVRPAMVKAAEHLRAKKAAEAAEAQAAAADVAAAAAAAAVVAESKQIAQPQAPIQTAQDLSAQTVQSNESVEAASARGDIQQLHRSPTVPTDENPPAPIGGPQKSTTDVGGQPAHMKLKTVPVSKPPMVRPVNAPNSKQTLASAPGPANHAINSSAHTPVPGQTKDGFCFEMKMRREHAELCSRLPTNVLDITHETLTEMFSGSEMSRMCGYSNEYVLACLRQSAVLRRHADVRCAFVLCRWKRSKHLVAERLLRLLHGTSQ